MAYKFKWKPSKAKIAEFKEKLKKQENEIDQFYKDTGIYIITNDNMSSYYFEFENVEYRISTHHLPNHNRSPFDEFDESTKYRNYRPFLSNKKVIEKVTNSRDNLIKIAYKIVNKELN